MSSASGRPAAGSRITVKQEDNIQVPATQPQGPATQPPLGQNGAGPSTEPGIQAGGTPAAAGLPGGQPGQGGAAPGPLGPRPAGQPQAQGRLLARADTAYSAEWTSEEQTTLDALAAKLTAEKYKDPLERALRIAAGLKRKNVRDVALRLRWIATVQANKKRKLAAAGAAAESDAKKQQKMPGLAAGPKLPGQGPLAPFQAAAFAAGGPGALPPMQPMPMLDDHGGASVGGIGGPIGQLLDQNLAYLNQFRTNMQCFKVNENTDLLVRFRDNILGILQQMNGMQGVMSQMPALPVRLNVELANNFLPKAGTPPLFMGMPPMMAPGGMHSMAMPMNSCYMMPPGMRMPVGAMSSGFPQAPHAGLTGLPQAMPGMVPAPPASHPPMQTGTPMSNPSAGPPQAGFPVSFPPASSDAGPAGTPHAGSAPSPRDGRGSQQAGDMPDHHLQQQQQQQPLFHRQHSGPQLSQDGSGFSLGSQPNMSLGMGNPSASQQQQLQQQLLQWGGQPDGLHLQQQQQQQQQQQLLQQQWHQQVPALHVNPGSVKLEPAEASNPPTHESSQPSGPAPSMAAAGPGLNPQLQQWQLQQNGGALGSGDQAQQQQQQMSLLQFHQQQMQLQWMQDARHGLNPHPGEETKPSSQQLLQQVPPQQHQQQSPQQLSQASLAQLQATLQA